MSQKAITDLLSNVTPQDHPILSNDVFVAGFGTIWAQADINTNGLFMEVFLEYGTTLDMVNKQHFGGAPSNTISLIVC